MKKTYFAFVLIFLFHLLNNMLRFFFPIYFDNLGLSGFEIGFIVSLYSISSLFFLFHIGLFADRNDLRLLISFGIILSSIHLIGLRFFDSFIIICMLFFLGGLGRKIFDLSTDTFILKRNEKGIVFGIYDSFRSIATAIGMLIGGLLLFSLDFTNVMLGIGILTLIITGLVFFIPRSEKSMQGMSLYFDDAKNAKLFLILIFIFTFHWGVENTVYSLFLQDNLGMNLKSIGVFMSIPILFLSLASIYFGRRYDKGMPIKKIFFYSFIVSGLGLMFMGLSNSVEMAFIFRVIHEIGDGMFIIFMFVGASSFFPKDRIGGNFGILTLVTVLSQVLGAIIFSMIGNMYGYHWPHIIVGLLIALAALFAKKL